MTSCLQRLRRDCHSRSDAGLVDNVERQGVHACIRSRYSPDGVTHWTVITSGSLHQLSRTLQTYAL